jgi:NADH:ubiquinone oxidoreductase subunit 6 (subunit J)
MKALSALTKLGLFAFILVMLNEVMSHSMWGTSSSTPPSTIDFALSLYGDEWAVATVILGALLAMAMVGASYLVRDERLVNLIWDMGGDES